MSALVVALCFSLSTFPCLSFGVQTLKYTDIIITIRPRKIKDAIKLTEIKTAAADRCPRILPLPRRLPVARESGDCDAMSRGPASPASRLTCPLVAKVLVSASCDRCSAEITFGPHGGNEQVSFCRKRFKGGKGYREPRAPETRLVPPDYNHRL